MSLLFRPPLTLPSAYLAASLPRPASAFLAQGVAGSSWAAAVGLPLWLLATAFQQQVRALNAT